MPHKAVTVPWPRRRLRARASAAAGLALLGIAPHAAAQSAKSAAVDQCVADHVAGQEVRLQSRLLEARTHFRACAQSTCPAVVAQACADFLRELEPRIPSVVPVVRDSKGDDVIDGALTIDGKAVPLAEQGLAREVEPGPHELTFARGGQVIAKKTVMVSEGEKNRRLPLTLPGGPAEPPEAPTEPRQVVGWIGIGLGAAALVGTGVLWGLASSEYAQLKSDGACAPRCKESDLEGARTKALLGDVLLGGGLAFVAAGALAVLWPRGPASAPPKAVAAPYLMMSGQGAALGLVIKAF